MTTAISRPDVAPGPGRRRDGMERLVEVIQDLSLARTLPRVMEIVRSAARELTGADGATFVLRDGDLCYYADEDAIAPLWKGRRFPMASCISGWVMVHREPAVVPDIFSDPRIPIDAYRPTFVKSLAMVPIRIEQPIGAIGNYWAKRHRPTVNELRLLQALAHSASVAIENAELVAGLEQRVLARTREIAAKNEALQELQRQKEALSALLVHDIRSPAATLVMTAKMRLRAAGLPDGERPPWQRVVAAGETIARMAENLLDIAKSEDGSLCVSAAPLELGALARSAAESLAPIAEGRRQAIELELPPEPVEVEGDGEILRRVLQNLLDNALRFSPEGSRVRLALRAPAGAALELCVDDQGPGIPPELRAKVFEKYVRLAGSRSEDMGRGLGLTFCRLAIEAHGGEIVADANAEGGSSFRVRLPRSTAS